jgi:predicted GNAT superfamily acetyltransferase
MGDQSERDGIAFRSLRSVADLDACLRLQTRIWGDDLMGAVPPMMLKVIQEAGGVLAGAFAEGAEAAMRDEAIEAGEMLGFVCGLAGWRQGRPVHWSHMLGVHRAARDHGLGRRLKWLQRELVLAQGIDAVYWTFDPLEARNAHLNFNRLGVELDAYRRDFYQGLLDSHRVTGIGTDRFVVAWPLRHPRVERARSGALPEPATVERYATAPVVNVEPEGSGAQDEAPRPLPEPQLPGGDRARVEIPAKIQHVKRASEEGGAAWRRSTRAAFERLLADGFRVETFYRQPADGRCFYGLRRSAAGEPEESRDG